MATLLIRTKKKQRFLKIPHKIYINRQFVGMENGSAVRIEMPAGRYLGTIQSVFPLFHASIPIEVHDGVGNELLFEDRERWWDILFAIDIVLWIAKAVITKWFPELTAYLPEHWELIYDIVTNGYFALWLIYEWRIRDKYFKLTFVHTVEKAG